MPYDGLTSDATAKAMFQLTVGLRQAVMLPHVFLP